MSRYSKTGKKRPSKKVTVFSKAEVAGRPATLGGMIGSALTVGIATMASAIGVRTAGPIGITAGIGAGVAVEGAKHYAIAGLSAMMNRKGGKSGGGSGGSGGGGDATVEGLRAAVTSIADELTSSTSGAVLSAIQVIEESVNTFGTVTDGSSAYAVEEVKTQLANAFTACDEARSLYTGAAESARAWAAGV